MHPLNVLCVLMKDSVVGPLMHPYVSSCLILALDGYHAQVGEIGLPLSILF